MAVGWVSRIPAIIAETPVRADALAFALAEETAQVAGANAPTATGTLKNSIEANSRRGTVGVVAVWYWFFVEFGTVNQGARPFMLPAFEMGLASLPSLSKRAFAGL